MKNYLIIYILLIISVSLSSCSKSNQNDAGTTSGTTQTESMKSDSSKVMTKNENQKPPLSGVNTIRAKFVKFELGDASHFVFVDESGKEWDFADNESKYDFAMELSGAEATTANQGWGSNTKLLGKWFNIKFEVRKQPLYEGGEIEDVMIITEASQ